MDEGKIVFFGELMLSELRTKIKPFSSFVSKPFIKAKIDPNIISTLGLVFAIVGAIFVIRHDWVLAFIFFVLAPLMDLIDGNVARALNKRSNWGNYYETMIDKLVDFVMLGSFALVPGFALPAVLALGFSAVASYAKPRVALIVVTDNRDWPGIGEHADKLSIVLIGLFLAAIGLNLIYWFLCLIALISFVGLLQRMLYAKGLIEEAEKKGTLLPYIKKRKER